MPIRLALATCLALLAFPTHAEDQAPAKVVPAAEARRHLDEICTVEMTVRLTKEIPDKVCYLDSEADYKDSKNVAVMIAASSRENFQKAKIDDIRAFYKGKLIRVTGRVVFASEQVRIHVDDPKQIEVVNKD